MDDKLISSNENNNINNVTSDNKACPKKSKNSMNIIKAALYMLKKNKIVPSKLKKSKSSPDLSNATNETISRLEGSIRPLCLQNGVVGGQSPPLPPHLPKHSQPLPPHSPKYFHSGDQTSHKWGEALAEMSPRGYEPSTLRSCFSYSSLSQFSCSSSSIGGASGYNSAHSVCDLNNHGNELISGDTYSNDAYYDGIEEDEMIDSKADMFIAKMYQQMRLE